MLIDLSELERLEVEFETMGNLGGEDGLLCYRVLDAGGSVHWSSRARLDEPVGPERTSTRALVKRSFRSGIEVWLIGRQGTGPYQQRTPGATALQGALRMLAFGPLVGLAGVAATLRGERTSERVNNLLAKSVHHAAFGAGLTAGIVGIRVHAYGASDG